MTRRIRLSHILVQPVLVYDDDDELTPGPETQTLAIPLSGLADFADKVRGDLATMNASSGPHSAADCTTPDCPVHPEAATA